MGSNLDYKGRLIKLNILPLMYYFEIANLFTVNSLKSSSHRFDIFNYISHITSVTRLSYKLTLQHVRSSSNISNHFFFHRIPRLWNKMPFINLSLETNVIRKKLFDFLWEHFTINFNVNMICSYHFLCHCAKCTAYIKQSYN